MQVRPINCVFYMSLEATFVLNLRSTPRNWYCCKTSIADEDAKMTFYALDNNGDFKVNFCTLIFDYYKCLLSKQWSSSSNAWGLSMSGILCVGWFKINMEEFAKLCNTVSLKFERVDEVSYMHVCIWLMSLILIFFSCVFLEMNLW